MPMQDQYHTLAAESRGEFKDRGSKFLAYAFPVYSEQDWKTRLEAVRKEHFKARHHCFAFRLGLSKDNFRANDDGEPSGTAGRPILGQIDSFGLTNILIVVVRYFGGTKLGASGLINAYRTGAAEALKNAIIIEKTVEDIYRLSFDYGLMSRVMNIVKKLDLELTGQDFGHTAKIELAIRQSDVEQQLTEIKAAVAGVRIEEVAGLEEIPGFQLSYLSTR